MERHNKGRKTPGGVFIALLKQNPDVDQNELEKVISNHAQFAGCDIFKTIFFFQKKTLQIILRFFCFKK